MSATAAPAAAPRARVCARGGTALCLALALLAQNTPHARAEDTAPAQPPPTFAYTTPEEAEPDHLRALLELSGILTFGFLWYLTSTDIAKSDYDIEYNWPMFRRKLAGEAIGLDSNHFGTNFIGHPLGGTAYYTVARGNRLSIAESFGLSFGGSLLWEYFGEARERVSLNDMIVTPIAGVAIGEPWTQLGAFFDRSSPSLRNRILGSFFAPFKSLNDALDGRSPARAEQVDRYGFPTDEWHQFDLRTAVALTLSEPKAPDEAGRDASFEWRFALVSHLARLPGFDEPGRHSLVFADGNVSSITLEGAVGETGFVDLNLTTQFVLLGHYFHQAELRGPGELWGSDLLIGLTTGYQYTVHDYDRDRPQPIDRISGVQPLGVLLAHRALFGPGRLLARLEAAASFAGVSPYALTAYRGLADRLELPEVIRDQHYYYALGGMAGATLNFNYGLFEAQASASFESYTKVDDGPQTASDQRTRLGARVGTGIAGTPARITALVEHRSRAGELGRAKAARGELSIGLEIGARF